jgi:hypothetical protein
MAEAPIVPLPENLSENLIESFLHQKIKPRIELTQMS